MENKTIISILLVPTLILLLPLAAMQFTAEVNWDLADFAVAWILMVGTGFTYTLVTKNARNAAYWAAIGMALASALLIVWMNLAVGLIGNEGDPANLMYGAVIVVGIIGTIIARFQPHGMARAMLATAIAQMIVPAIASVIWQTHIPPGMWGANALFVIMFVGSALLFRHAGRRTT